MKRRREEGKKNGELQSYERIGRSEKREGDMNSKWEWVEKWQLKEERNKKERKRNGVDK